MTSPATPLPRIVSKGLSDQATLKEFLGSWLPAIKMSVKPSTFASYRCNVVHHVAPRIGHLPLAAISPLDLNGLYVDLLECGRSDGSGGLSPKTVHYVHTIIHRALRDAVRWGLVATNPAERCDPPRQVRPDVSGWTSTEAKRFLTGVQDDRLYALYLLAITTGMRRGELLGLEWDLVDFEGARLSVCQALVVVNYEVQVSSPKAKRSRRSVALDESSLAALAAWRSLQEAERKAAGPDWVESSFVFTRQTGGPLHPHSVTQGFDRCVKRLGLERIRFHDLRHTSASLALAAGIHPKVVSERLGHASVMITLDTYSHVIPTLQVEAAAQIAALVT